MEKQSLKNVYRILNDILNLSKTNDKIKYIKQHKDEPYFKKCVFYALDFNLAFNITEISFKENIHSNIDETFNFLDKLSKKRGATDNEKNILTRLASVDKETVDVINRILSKNLKCGAAESHFKKIFTDLPVFKIMTCKSNIDIFLKRAKKLNLKIFASIKLDGVRTANIEENGVFRHISRSGLEYPNFNIFDNDLKLIKEELKKYPEINCNAAIDGESTTTDKEFQKLMTSIRTHKAIDKTKFRFNVFDICDNSGITFEERYKILEKVFNNLSGKLDYTTLVEHWDISHYTEKYQYIGLMNYVVNNLGEEGIVLKLGNSPYEFKEHSSNWCKLKPFETVDLKVIDFYYGEPGKKFEKFLGGFICTYNGKEVRVGGGFTEEEREYYIHNLPKIIEVKYKSITNDGSLREPVFVRVRDDK